MPNEEKAKWYQGSAFLISVGVVLMILAVGSVAAFRFGIQSTDSGREAAAQTQVAATSATGTEEEGDETPLASAAEQMVASMSLEEKIGQMMMVGFSGGGVDPQITEAIQKRHIGAVILFERNIASKEQVTALNAALQKLAADAEQPLKLMIATDQEGGETRRFKDIGPFYSQPMIGEMHDAAPDAAQQQASSAARDLKKLGINTNLAPVADVTSGWGSIMDGRSYNEDAAFVAELSARAVKGYNNATTISAAKHFPGHGSSDDDTEDTLAKVDKDLESLKSTDLAPFAAVIQENAPMIMVAHLVVPALDASNTPASLSKPIITDLLRGAMGFKGVVITDDMEMGAISETRSVGDAAVAAVAAGADIVMVAHTAAAQEEAYIAILDAVKSGKISEEEIDRSVARIVEMKKKYRLER